MSGVQINLEKDCGAPATRLWNVLIEPGLWWGEDVLLEPRPGGRFHEPWQDDTGQHHTRGRVLEIEPNTLLRLSWQDDDWTFRTEVQFRIEGQERRARIHLAHSGWQDAPEDLRSKLIDDHRGGWSYHLTNLVSAAEKAG